MPKALVTGRLAGAATAPARGERSHQLVRLESVVVTQILSGVLDAPVDFCRDVDEVAVVLAGSAVLEVDGTAMELGVGDWVLLPAGTTHRLVSTAPGTNWLTVEVHAT